MIHANSVIGTALVYLGGFAKQYSDDTATLNELLLVMSFDKSCLGSPYAAPARARVIGTAQLNAVETALVRSRSELRKQTAFSSFEEARKYVRTLNLSSQRNWREWCKSEKRSSNIPTAPQSTYKMSGWLSWPDWLGYGEGKLPTNSFLPFGDAREYARALNISTQREWQHWSASGKRPDNIPSNPRVSYRSRGWINWSDWLGNYKSGPHHLPFDAAREFVRTLNLTSHSAWKEWRRNDERAYTIPGEPDVTYKSQGWLSWPDFLGYGEGCLPKGDMFLPFDEAREYVRSLKLKGKNHYVAWRTSSERPLSIPTNPDRTYKSTGWVSWPDWLDYHGQEFMNFEDARDIVHGMGLLSRKEWICFCDSGALPLEIPRNPHHHYKSRGWKSWRDWLHGCENPKVRRPAQKFLDFEDARDITRGIGLRSQKEWNELCDSGALPLEIPRNPRYYYKSRGWKSWPDWLGYGGRSRSIPFEEARKLSRTMGLSSRAEWKQWHGFGLLPVGIPKCPEKVYKAWKGWPDWLGYSIHSCKKEEMRVVFDDNSWGDGEGYGDEAKLMKAIYSMFAEGDGSIPEGLLTKVAAYVDKLEELGYDVSLDD